MGQDIIYTTFRGTAAVGPSEPSMPSTNHLHQQEASAQPLAVRPPHQVLPRWVSQSAAWDGGEDHFVTCILGHVRTLPVLWLKKMPLVLTFGG